MIDAAAAVGTHDFALVTLDALRYDVAQRLHLEGRTPVLSALLPPEGWEARHTPASFTFPAHQAFFAGFLPTPMGPGPHRRLLALRFPGSSSVGPGTAVFDAPDVVAGFRTAGYRTICIGGTGFFDKRSALGKVLPGLFDVSRWGKRLGVTERDSTRHQVEAALGALGEVGRGVRAFLFMNVSAIHHPNRMYVEGARRDDLETHAAALEYADRELAPLFAALRARGPTVLVVCSDHGTCYGEDGHQGHRVAHPAVWTVPYRELVLA